MSVIEDVSEVFGNNVYVEHKTDDDDLMQLCGFRNYHISKFPSSLMPKREKHVYNQPVIQIVR